jgi:hypothetical protein
MASSDLYERIRFTGRPRPHAEAVVVRGDVRFTVLSSRLLRLEWSETGEFEDRATYAFPVRYAAPPAFTVREEGGVLWLDTGDLRLRYVAGTGAFTPENLSIEFPLDGERRVWQPGMPDSGNLRGTRRTLDHCAGDASLDPGLISREGWTLFDDTKNVVFTDDGWVGPRPDFELQDWYFFGYGHDYTAALQEYAQFGGAVPLVPRFILGAWWSRYWAYSEQDLRELVAEFEAHGVPLDVFVIDMDWHTPHAWTGYTWNRELFPDPPAFLKWVHSKGLRTTLNLHPAQGVQAFEEVYPQFAQALELDPVAGEPVPFQIADRRFVQHYFEMLHHPMEDDGVDFWWMDWQQGEISEVKGLDPLPWINHLHFNDIKRRGVRPMLYSRWGGLGNHRYHIGFSGDTYVTWSALQFQPYMTASASNVLYGWWSHDIGGHMGGATEPELYARWVQFGALSPVLRLHSTKDPRCERRPWAYPEPVYEAAKLAFLWRYRLIPYLYTMARVAADTSISLCRPMYYEDPRSDAAYAARHQYYFGDQMIAAPIVSPVDPQTGLAGTDVWLPAGTWTTYDTLETFNGPGWIRVLGDLNRMPMLMKEGAILPLAPDFAETPSPWLRSGTTDTLPADELILSLFPGEGSSRVYRDDGLTEAHLQGQHEWLPVRTWQADEGRQWSATVGPVEGCCDALPEACGYELHFVGSTVPERVLLDGQPVPWIYDPDRLTTRVGVQAVSRERAFTVTLEAPVKVVALGPDRNRQQVEADVARLLGDRCPSVIDLDTVMASGAPEVAIRHAVARLGGPFFHAVPLVTREEVVQQLGRVVIEAPAGGVPMDAEIIFRGNREGHEEIVRVTRSNVTEGFVIGVPFAFDGTVARFQWWADVTLAWEGRSISGSYESAPYFPGIYRWHALLSEGEGEEATGDDVIAAFPVYDSYFEELVQDPRMDRDLTELFLLRLWEHYREQLAGEDAPTAYLQARVVSPRAREVVLELVGAGGATLFVNGESVAVGEPVSDPQIPAFFRPPRRSDVFSLREGENNLIVRLPASGAALGGWFLAAEIYTLDGRAVPDLSYR